MPPDAIVCFSAGALLTVGGILTTLTGAISGLFIALRLAYASHLKSKDEEIVFLRDVAFSATSVAEKTVAGPRRRQG